VLVRGMVRDEIQDDPDVPVMQFVDQAIEIIEASKNGIDGTVVGGIVAEV